MSNHDKDISAGGNYTGRDDIGGDQLHTDADRASNSVIGSKGVRQTRNDSPEVTVNNYERNRGNVALVDLLEAKLEAQIDRLEDKVGGRIDNLENNMNTKLEFLERDIGELQWAPSRFLIPVLTIMATLLMVIALFYFAAGLYSLSNEMKLQRLDGQKSGSFYGKPQNSMGFGER